MTTTVPAINAGIARVHSVVLYAQGQFTTAALTAFMAFRTPQKVKVLGISGAAYAKGGTHTTQSATFDVLNGTVSLLSAVLDLGSKTAGTRQDGALTATTANLIVSKDSELNVSFGSTGGTSPTMDKVSIQIDYIAIEG